MEEILVPLMIFKKSRKKKNNFRQQYFKNENSIIPKDTLKLIEEAEKNKS